MIRTMISMLSRLVPALAAAASPGLAQTAGVGGTTGADGPFTREFFLEDCDFATTGANPYFILEPGYRLVLEGNDEGEHVVLLITVTDRIERVGDVDTRVVVEREIIDGELFEVARNFFAICKQTNSVVYFGEEVDFYEDGVIVGHEGSWRAEDGNQPGLIMPGTLLLGSRYFQEIAPDVAMDRAEILELDAIVQTPLGRFKNALKTRETTPLEPDVVELKFYGLDVGLLKDGPVRLVRAFFVGAGELGGPYGDGPVGP